MKLSLKLEEFGMFILSFLAFDAFGGDWIAFILLLFIPDLGMLGYLINNRAGAITYNLLHHKGIATLIIISGLAVGTSSLIFIGIVLFAHSSIDRALGYGLKKVDGFNHTHLGNIKPGESS